MVFTRKMFMWCEPALCAICTRCRFTGSVGVQAVGGGQVADLEEVAVLLLGAGGHDDTPVANWKPLPAGGGSNADRSWGPVAFSSPQPTAAKIGTKNPAAIVIRTVFTVTLSIEWAARRNNRARTLT